MDEKRLKKLLHSITKHADKIREAQETLEYEFGVICCWGVSAGFADTNNKVSMQITEGINDIIDVLNIEYEDRKDIRIATFDGLKIVQVANKETGEFD